MKPNFIAYLDVVDIKIGKKISLLAISGHPIIKPETLIDRVCKLAEKIPAWAILICDGVACFTGAPCPKLTIPHSNRFMIFLPRFYFLAALATFVNLSCLRRFLSVKCGGFAIANVTTTITVHFLGTPS